MGIFMSPDFRIRNTDSPHHTHGFCHRRFFIHSSMKSQRFSNLFPAFDNRIQGSHRFLKNHGYLISPNLLHLFLRCFHQILPFIENLSAGNLPRRIRNQLHHAERGYALPASTFSYDTQFFTFMQSITKVINRLNGALHSFKFHTQIFYL